MTNARSSRPRALAPPSSLSSGARELAPWPADTPVGTATGVAVSACTPWDDAAVVLGGAAEVETPETPLDGEDVDVEEPPLDGEVVVVDGGAEVVAVEEPPLEGVVLCVTGGVVAGGVVVLVWVGFGQITVRVGVGIGVPHHEPPFDEPWKGKAQRVDVLVGVTVAVGVQVECPEPWNGRMQDGPCGGILVPPPEPWWPPPGAQARAALARPRSTANAPTRPLAKVSVRLARTRAR